MERLYIAKIYQNNTESLIVTDGVKYGHITTCKSLNSLLRLNGNEIFKLVSEIKLLLTIESSSLCNTSFLEDQPVWATGITYPWNQLKIEQTDDKDFYKKLYFSERPMFFYKGDKKNHASFQGNIGIRADVERNIPEAELVAVFNSYGEIIGFTLGNDQTAMSLENENPLYQFQAKHFNLSYTILPMIYLHKELPTSEISLVVLRKGQVILETKYSTNDFFRSLCQISNYLFKSNTHQDGIFLFLGFNGSIPLNFTLEKDDIVKIKSDLFPLSISQKCIIV